MTVFLVPNLQKEKSVSVAQQTIAFLHDFGAEVCLAENMRAHFAQQTVQFLSEAAAVSLCDVIVTIGGDGTMLHTARKSFGCGKPLLGVNLGRMGFLATVEPDELQEKLYRLVRGDYILDRRGILNVSVQGENRFSQNALNDVVISKISVSQTVDIEVYCDDILVNHYQGDGVIVATPTGSTAYSLSAGGPILDARIDGIVVTPICAHSLHSPSMVFSAHRKLRVCVSSPSAVNAYLSCDGRGDKLISCNDQINIAFSDVSMTLICFNEADQFEAIDKKLKGR